MCNCKPMSPFFLICLLLGGCGLVLPPMNPITYADREVESIIDPQKQIIFNESMVFYNSIFKSEGIKFPDGVYTLEAENEAYYYFAAPEKLEYRTYSTDGTTNSIHHYSGGLFYTKSILNRVPGGAYYTVNDIQKVHFWKLGGEFVSEKGYIWNTTD